MPATSSNAAQLVFIDLLDQSGSLQLQQFGGLGDIALGSGQRLLDQAALDFDQMLLE
jgi:hypothetical protein